MSVEPTQYSTTAVSKFLRSLRKHVNSLMQLSGFEVRRIPATRNDPDSVAAKTVNQSSLYANYETYSPIFLPWRSEEFQRKHALVWPNTSVSIDRCHLLAAVAEHAVNLNGDFAECGVYRGGTGLLLAQVINRRRVLHLFDSFKGLPKPNETFDNFYGEGDFGNTTEEQVRNLVRDFENEIVIHPGWIPETFSAVADRTFSFVHVDLDLYQPVLDACEFFYRRLARCGVIVFDDYGFPACRGEKDAVDEFFADKPERPICLPTGQAIIVRL